MESSGAGMIKVSVAAAVLVGALSATALGAFGTGGKTIVNVGGPNSANDVAIAKDGSVIGAGSAVPGATFDVAVVRLDSAGVPAPSFSGDGKQTTDVGGFDISHSVVIQRNGAIVVGGSSDAIDDQRRATIVRYEEDGDPDPTFSQDGIQIFPFEGSPSGVDDMALQKDGKVVIAGSIGSKALIARVKSSGKLDKGFGKKGFVRFGVEEGTDIDAVAIQKDGRIVVGGETSGTMMGDPSSQVFARVTREGKLDKSFSGDGILIRKLKGASSRVEDIAIEKSGRIVGVVGIFDSDSPDSSYGVTAIKPNGKLDKRFGKKGLAVRDFGDDTLLAAIAVQKSGGIVVGGGVRSGDVDFLLARFTKKGKLDESFGFKGATITDFAGGSSDLVQSLAIGKQDVIVAAGIGDGDFGFARYTKNGAIDD